MADEKTKPLPMNEDQVKNLLKFIDATQSEHVKNEVFSQNGYNCFHCRGLEERVRKSGEDVAAFLDRINNGHSSVYWESLVFNEDRTALYLTGRPVENCACAFADCENPPKALCTYCCKTFQETYFSTLFGGEVEVEITESFLYGSNRCSTVIRFPNRMKVLQNPPDA